jgi:hypothetical protein
MSVVQARADSWKQGLDEALQRGTASLKALRMHMQQQEADFRACMQQHEAKFRAQQQQREAEFKALEKVCFANVEATAKLHKEADERAGRLKKRFDISRSKEKRLADDVACIKDKKKSLKEQNKGLTQEVKDQQLTIVDLQSSLEAYKGNTSALEGQNASLLQRSLDLEHEQTALKEQIQSLQRDLTSAHAQQAASSQSELAQAAAAVALLEKQVRQTEARESVLKSIVLLMGEQQNALTGEKSKLETDFAAALQANQALAASIQAADTIIAQHAASLAAAKAEAKQTFDQHAKVLAAAEAAAQEAAQQAAKQAADAADMQASNHLASMRAITQAAKTEAMAEAAQSHAADKASWAAEKADLVEKLQAANARHQFVPDARASQLFAELASTQHRIRSAEQRVADTHGGSTPVTNAQIRRQHLAADSLSSHAQVTATLARAVALSSQHGQSSVLGAVQQAPGMHLQGMPREGACWAAPLEHSSHDQHSDSRHTVEQVMQQLQQLQESCRQMLGVQCDADGQVACDQVPGISASIGRLAKQVQELQDSVPHALGVPHAARAPDAASQHSAHDQQVQGPVTVAKPKEQLQRPQQQQQQAPDLSVQPQGMSASSDAAQSCQQGRVVMPSEAGHPADALPLRSNPGQNSPGQGYVSLQPEPVQNGHFRSETVSGNADGLVAELMVQQGQQGTSAGILALLH